MTALSRVFRLSSQAQEEERQLLFLTHLARHGIITRALMESAVRPYELRDWRAQTSPGGFADLFQFAIDCAADAIESEAWERAMVGVEEPVFGAHGPVGTRIVKSEGLLRELLKARKPGHFRDRPSAAPLPDQAARRSEYEAQLERLRLRQQRQGGQTAAPGPAPSPAYASGQAPPAPPAPPPPAYAAGPRASSPGEGGSPPGPSAGGPHRGGASSSSAESESESEAPEDQGG